MVRRCAPKEEKARYLREWKAANRDKVRRANREYARRARERDPERIRSQQFAYYTENREYRLAMNKAWRDRLGTSAPNRTKKSLINSASREVASRARRRWTADEDVAVLADSGLAELAWSLNRSVSAVEQRRRFLRKKADR